MGERAMNLPNKEEARQHTRMLVELRQRYAASVKKAQELLKEQQTVRKTLQRLLQQAPCSVPQLAAAARAPADEILWHIAAMKKYGIVEEAGMDENGEYYLYRLSKEARS